MFLSRVFSKFSLRLVLIHLSWLRANVCSWLTEFSTLIIFYFLGFLSEFLSATSHSSSRYSQTSLHVNFGCVYVLSAVWLSVKIPIRSLRWGLKLMFRLHCKISYTFAWKTDVYWPSKEFISISTVYFSSHPIFSYWTVIDHNSRWVIYTWNFGFLGTHVEWQSSHFSLIKDKKEGDYVL